MGQFCVISYLDTALHILHHDPKASYLVRKPEEAPQALGLDASGSARSGGLRGLPKAETDAGIHV